MQNFKTMTLAELSAEVERYQMQLIRQQADKIPLTPAQIRRWEALSGAYKRKNNDLIK